MGRPVAKIADDWFGIEPPKMPDPVVVTPAPAAREDIEKLPDAQAVRVSKERLEQMKRRKGRSSLRQDLAIVPSVGAGVAIPK